MLACPSAYETSDVVFKGSDLHVGIQISCIKISKASCLFGSIVASNAENIPILCHGDVDQNRHILDVLLARICAALGDDILQLFLAYLDCLVSP